MLPYTHFIVHQVVLSLSICVVVAVAVVHLLLCLPSFTFHTLLPSGFYTSIVWSLRAARAHTHRRLWKSRRRFFLSLKRQRFNVINSAYSPLPLALLLTVWMFCVYVLVFVVCRDWVRHINFSYHSMSLLPPPPPPPPTSSSSSHIMVHGKPTLPTTPLLIIECV